MEIQDPQAKFENEMKHHQCHVLHDDGEYRNFQIVSLRDPATWYQIVTVPNRLWYFGSVASYTFSYFCTNHEYSVTDLFAGTSPLFWRIWKHMDTEPHGDPARQFSLELFTKNVLQYAEMEKFPEPVVSYFKSVLEIAKATDDHTRFAEDFLRINERNIVVDGRLYECKIVDNGELLDSSMEFSPDFEWSCYAIQWGLATFELTRSMPDYKGCCAKKPVIRPLVLPGD